MQSIKELYDLWPSAAAMASDIGARGGTVRQWRNRGYRIPTAYWLSLRRAVEAKGHELPFDLLLHHEVDG